MCHDSHDCRNEGVLSFQELSKHLEGIEIRDGILVFGCIEVYWNLTGMPSPIELFQNS